MPQHKFKHLRVFYAHSSGESPEDTVKAAKILSSLIEEKLKKKYITLASTPIVHVVPGRKDHTSFFKGDWEKWQKGVVKRKHAMTGKPRYQMFVVPGEYCGRATAEIARLAMEEGRAVIRWDQKKNKLFPVKKIIVFDPEDWTSGFQLA